MKLKLGRSYQHYVKSNDFIFENGVLHSKVSDTLKNEKMKILKNIIISAAIFLTGNLYAQTEIYFDYDDAGNRTMRFPVEGMVENQDDGVEQAGNTNQPSTLNQNQSNQTLIADENGELSLSFYPNPVKDDLIVDIYNTTDKQHIVSLEIYDTAGKIVLSESLSGNSSQLDVSSLS